MRILELNIDVFGGLKQKRIELSEGLNIIEGENESGKSTLMLFIKFMLYGMPRKGNEERERSISRSEHCARGSMTLSFEGEGYRIERSFTEGTRTGSERLSVYRLSDGEEVFRGSEPGEVFLKVPREVFESSAFVGQMMCQMTGGKKGAEAIRNLLTTADDQTDLSRVVEKLEKIRVGYRHRTGKGGRLPDMSADLHAQKQRLERAVSDGLRLSELEKKSEELSAQCREAEERLNRAEATLRQAAKIDILKRFDGLHEKQARFADIEDELARFSEEHGMDENPLEERDAARLSALADQLESAERKERSAREDYDALADGAAYDAEAAEVGEILEQNGGADVLLLRMEGLSRKARALGGFGWVFLLLGALTAVAGFTALDLLMLTVGGGVACVLGVILLLCGSSASGRARALAREYGTDCKGFSEYLAACRDALAAKRRSSDRLTRCEEALRLASAHLSEIREWMRDELAKYGEEDSEPSVALAKDYAKQIREILDEYNTLRTKRSVCRESVRSEEQQLGSYDETALRRELSEAGIDENTPLNLQKAEQERRWVETQRTLLRQKKEGVDIERISLAATVEDPMPLADRLSLLQSDYERAEDYYESLEMALTALREAGDAMSGNVTPILGKRAGEIMEFLSEGRYVGFYAGNDLIPSLEAREGFRVPSDLLSGGTRDAAYLALRLSLMLQIFEGELPPMILDESLCQMDDGRMARTVELLSKLSSTGLQVLLFTCQTRERAVCEKQGLSCRVTAL